MSELSDASPKPLNEASMLEENMLLRQQLADLQVRYKTLNNLLVGVNRKLQLSTASIKAAASSLLTLDFFWDVSSEHEFLQTIDISVDQISDLVYLVTLAIRSETDTLKTKAEPQMLQEILIAAADEVMSGLQNIEIDLDFPAEGKPALVDYEYFQVALKLLFEGIALANAENKLINVRVFERGETWEVYLDGLDQESIENIHNISCCVEEPKTRLERMVPENVLRIFVAAQLLRTQNILFEKTLTEDGENSQLYLRIPAYINNESDKKE